MGISADFFLIKTFFEIVLYCFYLDPISPLISSPTSCYTAKFMSVVMLLL